MLRALGFEDNFWHYDSFILFFAGEAWSNKIDYYF